MSFSNTITYHNVKLCVYVFFTLSDLVFIILDSTTSCQLAQKKLGFKSIIIHITFFKWFTFN